MERNDQADAFAYMFSGRDGRSTGKRTLRWTSYERAPQPPIILNATRGADGVYAVQLEPDHGW